MINSAAEFHRKDEGCRCGLQTAYFPKVKFERFADDIIVHCRYLGDAKHIKDAIEQRMKSCKLELHPEKTKVVFCQNRMRPSNLGYPTSFDFLGFTFRQRSAKGRDGKIFDGFLPAVSRKSLKSMSQQMKRWKANKASDLSLQDL